MDIDNSSPLKNPFDQLTIDKTAAGIENYAVEYHCVTNTNQHTGTDIQTITDQ